MSYQNFNTNIADPINYSANKFESINTFSNFKINFNKSDNHNDGYKEVNMLQKSFNNDLGRSGSSKDIDLITSLNNTFDSLKNDKMYKKEYDGFVANMCYGRDDKITNFNTALNDFKEIKEFAIERINTLENSIDNKDLDFDMDL